MNESEIQSFWEGNPCGEALVGVLDEKSREGYKAFFKRYDQYRYERGGHILKCLDNIDFEGKKVLEIGLGQGADAEQIIRRGGRWSGLDLTHESVERVKMRFELANLDYDEIKQGSALENPYPDNHFDIVFSHGVLLVIPEIEVAQREIARVLKPSGELIIMMYAKWSLNYLVSIAIFRRLGLILMYFTGYAPGKIYAMHLANAKEFGLWNYLKMENFIHRNTDGPMNPYATVYDIKRIKKDFVHFNPVRWYKRFMHAPPLPVRWMPFASWMGWHLWIHLRPKNTKA